MIILHVFGEGLLITVYPQIIELAKTADLSATPAQFQQLFFQQIQCGNTQLLVEGMIFPGLVEKLIP